MNANRETTELMMLCPCCGDLDFGQLQCFELARDAYGAPAHGPLYSKVPCDECGEEGLQPQSFTRLRCPRCDAPQDVLAAWLDDGLFLTGRPCAACGVTGILRPVCSDPDCDDEASVTTCDDGCGEPVCEEHVRRDRESSTRFCRQCYERELDRAGNPLPRALFVKGER